MMRDQEEYIEYLRSWGFYVDPDHVPTMLGQAIQEIEEDMERKRAAQAEAEKRKGETE